MLYNIMEQMSSFKTPLQPETPLKPQKSAFDADCPGIVHYSRLLSIPDLS